MSILHDYQKISSTPKLKVCIAKHAVWACQSEEQKKALRPFCTQKHLILFSVLMVSINKITFYTYIEVIAM